MRMWRVIVIFRKPATRERKQPFAMLAAPRSLICGRLPPDGFVGSGILFADFSAPISALALRRGRW
jgi:hypothetical protein